jgi:poly(3-hydroxybutyrate) depolymerase
MNTLRILGTACVAVVLAASGAARAGDAELQLEGRKAYVHAPEPMPADGPKALVIVLHGGLGNAERIVKLGAEHGLNLDRLADQGGFVVAYLDGTPMSRRLPEDALGWNAGGSCCGAPTVAGIDDVHYVAGAVTELAGRYGFGAEQVFGFGHSNGAMMLQRVVCEAGVFSAIVAVAGPLNLENSDCPGARGRRVLAIHGEDDTTVPVAGGVDPDSVLHTSFRPEAHSESLMKAAGAHYALRLVPGAGHPLEQINAALAKAGGKTVAEQAAEYFGLR